MKGCEILNARIWDSFNWSELANWIDSGLTTAQIAEKQSCSIKVVRVAMNNLGLKSYPGPRPGAQYKPWTEERRQNHYKATHTPEFRAKSRANLLNQMSMMNGMAANSPLEKLLQNALMKSGIGFSTQRTLCGKYAVDILITQAPIVIEADGRRHYLNADKDAERDREIGIAGYRVFRFVGKQINQDASACIAEVIRECNLEPDKEPVYDIRTGLIGSDNPNWTGGLKTGICSFCGDETPPRRAGYRAGSHRVFCDSKCYGKWMSAHPEESNRRKTFKGDVDWNEVASLYNKGMHPRDLAQKFGPSYSSINRKLRLMSIPVRADLRSRWPR